MAKEFSDIVEQSSYQLLLDIVDARAGNASILIARNNDRAEALLHELCRTYDLNPDAVIDVFHKASDATQTLTASERSLLAQISHPTLLDLPSYYPDHVSRWRDLMRLLTLSGHDPRTDVLSSDDVMLSFNAFLEGGKRLLLEGINLDKMSDAEIRRILRSRIQSEDLGASGTVIDLPEEASTTNFVAAMSARITRTKLRRDIPRYDRDFVATMGKLDRDYLRSLQDLREDYVTFAKDAAKSINAMMVASGAEGPVTPRTVFDLFHTQGMVKDPIILTWALKLSEDLDEQAPQSLLQHWVEMPPHAKPEDDRILRGILAKLDEVVPASMGNGQRPRLQIPAFTMAQLAQHFAVGEAELRDLLFSNRPDKKAWRATDDGTWAPVENGIFETLWRFLGYEKPEDLLPQPDWTPPVKLKPVVMKTADRPAVPQADPYQRAKDLFGEGFKPDELITAALALAKTDKNEARVRGDLEYALQHPSSYVRADGLPSLPHMLLMQARLAADKPPMELEAVDKAMHTMFGPVRGTYVPPAKTGYRAFVWMALKDMVDNGKPAASYADVLAHYDFKQANGSSINPERSNKDEMADRVLAEVDDLFDRAAQGSDLTGKRDTTLITKMVAVAGKILGVDDPREVVLGAFLGRVNRPGERAAVRLRQAFLAKAGR